MMKNSFYKVNVLAIVAAIFFTSSRCVFAQTYQEHFPANKVLESSLMGLKDSADQIAERNALLVDEIHNLRNKIQNLHEETVAMTAMKEQIAQNTGQEFEPGIEEAQLQKTRLSQLSMDRVHTELSSFAEDNAVLEQKVDAQKQTELDLTMQLTEAENNIAALKKEEVQLDNDLQNGPLEQQKQELLKNFRKTQEDLGHVQGSFDGASKKVSKPKEAMGSLKMHNEDLKQQLTLLKENEVSFEDQRKSISTEMLKIEQEFQRNALRVTEQIKELHIRKKNIENLLAQAKEKLEGKDLETAYSEQAEAQLKKDLAYITQENRSLKQETVLFEQTLEKMGTK